MSSQAVILSNYAKYVKQTKKGGGGCIEDIQDKAAIYKPFYNLKKILKCNFSTPQILRYDRNDSVRNVYEIILLWCVYGHIISVLTK